MIQTLFPTDLPEREWIARFHGLPGVFRPDRVGITLETLKRTSLTQSKYGASVFSKPEGRPDDGWDPGYWTLRGVHPPGTFMLAMLYLYEGQTDIGLDLARRVVSEIVRRDGCGIGLLCWMAAKGLELETIITKT
jgi:uncharacterized protein (DUF608 family)